MAVSADGLTGYGECVADADPFYLPETNGTVFHVLRDFLIPLALRLDFAHPRELRRAFARVRGHEMAKAALLCCSTGAPSTLPVRVFKAAYNDRVPCR